MAAALFHKTTDMATKKTYKTFSLRDNKYHFIGKGGSFVEIQFRGGIHPDSTAKYTTSNEEIQKFLESMAGFNRDFYLESVEEIQQAPMPEPVKKEEKKEVKPEPEKLELTDVKDYKRFRNIIEMRSAMEEVGFEGVQEMNYPQLKSAAAKAGYDYQISKK